MNVRISEHAFEDAIERGLLQSGPDVHGDDLAGVR